MSSAELEIFATILRQRYVAHEISAEQYAASMEDVKLVSRKVAS